MTICNHQFIHVADIDKTQATNLPGGGVMGGRFIPGAIVVCAKCAQVRKLWGDGTLEVVHQGQPYDEDVQ